MQGESWASMVDATSDSVSDESCTAARLFGIVWETMADVIGTTATATLVRRSIKRASSRRAELNAVSVVRRGLHYAYTVPEDWGRKGSDPVGALRELVAELAPLLSQLAGPVLIRRLASVPDLQRCQIHFAERAR